MGGNEEGKFQINSETGAVMTTDEFDRERTAMYSLQVETRSRAPDQHLYWTLIQVAVLVCSSPFPSNGQFRTSMTICPISLDRSRSGSARTSTI